MPTLLLLGLPLSPNPLIFRPSYGPVSMTCDLLANNNHNQRNVKGKKAEDPKAKEWPGKTIYFNFDSNFGDFLRIFFEELE